MTLPARVDVLIAGGGPVGSALALARQGVPSLTLEAEDGPPVDRQRAPGINLRSLEHVRRWGALDALRAQFLPAAGPATVSLRTAAYGWELGRFPRYVTRAGDSPVTGIAGRAPQHVVNAVLRSEAQRQGGALAGGWALRGLRQADGAVFAQAEHLRSGRRAEVRARFLVGCDGADSVVRQAAGIGRTGAASFGNVYPCRFRPAGGGDFPAGALPHGPELMACVFNDDAFGLGSLAAPGLWRGQIMGFGPDEEPSEATLQRHARALIGHPGALETVSLSRFRLHTRIAERYRAGRVFLAGDAAHVMPPFGGLNLNTGIGDAADLGWKLAAVLQGWGGDGLLDGYDRERRPLAQRVGTAALDSARAFQSAAHHLRRHGVPADDTAASQAAREALGRRLHAITRAQWNTDGLVLDPRYEQSPLVADDGSEVPRWDRQRCDPQARPGHRAPHALLEDGRSLYDAFGPGFTLLDLGAAGPQRGDALAAAARTRGVPLARVRIDSAPLRQLYDSHLVLVRPDQHVAWRDRGQPLDALAVVDTVRGAAV